MIPDGWIKTTIGDCLLDATTRNSDKRLTHDDLRSVNKSLGMVPMKDRVKGKSVERAKIVKNGWFAYNPMRINVGSICRWDNTEECIVSPDYVVFECDERKITGDYFDQFRQSHRWEKFMEDAGRGSVRIRIYLDDLKQLKCTLPPIHEQREIAQILNTWDKAIERTEKLIANSEAQKKALMQRLLTGKERLIGFSEKWFETHLGKVSDLYQPKTISQSDLTNEGYPVWGANGKIGYYPEFNHSTWQTMITCRGSTCGTVNRSEGKSWITGNSMVVNADNFEKVDKEFLYFYLSNADFRRLIGGSGQPQITRTPLLNYEICIPSDVSEQKKIAKILGVAHEKTHLLTLELDSLRQEKAALMQQLLTGKRRVKIKETAA